MLALEIIAWPSLSMQREMAALHSTHIVGLCHQQFEWQDALLSAFSLCFALTFPLLRISLSHTLFPWSRSLFLSHASHIICVFSFDAEHFYHYFPLGIIAAGATNSGYAGVAGGTSRWCMHKLAWGIWSGVLTTDITLSLPCHNTCHEDERVYLNVKGCCHSVPFGHLYHF